MSLSSVTSSRKSSKEAPPETANAGEYSEVSEVSDYEGSGISATSCSRPGSDCEAEESDCNKEEGRSDGARNKPPESPGEPRKPSEEDTTASRSSSKNSKTDTEPVGRREDKDDNARAPGTDIPGQQRIEEELGRFQHIIQQRGIGLTVQTDWQVASVEQALRPPGEGEVRRESVGVFLARAGYAEEASSPHSPVTPVPKAIPKTKMPWSAGHLKQAVR